MNEYIIRNYFLVRDEHFVHSVLLWFYFTTHICHVYLSKFTPSFKCFRRCSMAAVLFRLSILLRYLECSFFSIYPALYPNLVESGTVQLHSIESLDWYSLKNSNIVRYSEPDLIIFCQLSTSYLMTLIICRVVLLLILLILSWPCVYFFLFCSVCSLLALFLWYQDISFF